MTANQPEAIISVLVVDDDPFVRKAVSSILDEADDLRLIGEVGNGLEALEAVDASRPDVVLMDLEMPEMGGLEATRAICRNSSPPRILILTNHVEDRYIAETLRHGATGFLVKNTPPEELLTAIRAAHSGEAVLSGEVTRRMIDIFVSQGESQTSNGSWAERLTEREREVALAVADGQSNQEIADALYMSLSTVKTNVSRILAKLALNNRVQVALLVHGIDPEPQQS